MLALTLTPTCSHIHQTLKENTGVLIWQSTHRGTPPSHPRNIRCNLKLCCYKVRTLNILTKAIADCSSIGLSLERESP